MSILAWALAAMRFPNVAWKLVVPSDTGKIGDVHVGMRLLLLLQLEDGDNLANSPTNAHRGFEEVW